MQPQHSLAVLLSIVAVILFGVLGYLLFGAGERNTPSESGEVRRYQTVFTPPTADDSEAASPVSQNGGENEAAFGNDLQMEFPVLDE